MQIKIYLVCRDNKDLFRQEIARYNPTVTFVDSPEKADRFVVQNTEIDRAHGLYFRFPSKRPIMIIEMMANLCINTYRFVPKD